MVAGAPLCWLIWLQVAYWDHQAVVCCDWSVQELQVARAVRLQTELGPYSRYGWSHPGPTFSYLSVPLYLASGRQIGGLAATAAALNLVWVSAMVVLARRAGGAAAAWSIVVAAVVFYRAFGLEGLADPWNPFVVVLPVALVAVGSAATLAGVRAALPVTVAAGSLAVQSHLGSVPVVAGLMGVMGGAVLITAWRSRSVSIDRQWLIWLAGSAAILVVLWVLPLREQVTSEPGNLGQILQFLRTRQGSQSPATVVRTVGGQLTFAVPTMYQQLDPGGSWAPRGVTLVGRLAVFASLTTVLAVTALRRRQVFPLALAGSVLVGAAVASIAAARATGDLYPYLTTSALGLGLVLVATTTWGAARALPLAARRLVGAQGSATATTRWVRFGVVPLASALSLWSMVAADPRPFARRNHNPGLRRLVDDVASVFEPGTLVLVDPGGSWAVAGPLAARLDRDGEVVVPPDWEFLFGANRTNALEKGCVVVAKADAPILEAHQADFSWRGDPLGNGAELVVTARRGAGCEAGPAD